ncbi:hypothetical protein [Mesorhizobium sp. B1-1-5]|uniref:hypothetical protein n=1 Tax=Mesorhizobium sp. B1-1-5 TaxID=2589979 RepID=UPI00112B9F3C|nr:hypothetical protein [Mesorhizobium sp. B1-1-5]TPO05167.1 hypothetical protein FJ980_14950 [Mesorhizobium sp. B1-1-5]
MADWIDQNTFISDDGKVVRNGFYRDQNGALCTYFGPKPLNRPPSSSQLGSWPQEQDRMFVQGPAAKPALRSRQESSQDAFYEPGGNVPSIGGLLLSVIVFSILFGFLAFLKNANSPAPHDVKMNADAVSVELTR